MDIVKSSISCKIKNFINKNIETNIKNICRDISIDYDKCENLVKSYLFFIDKPVLELGLIPFLLAEAFKIALLALLTKKIIKLRKFI